MKHRTLRDDYADYLEGKRVIIVGPAGYMHGSRRGAEIDAYDVVVRINLDCPIRADIFQSLYPGKYAPRNEDVGTRTDVLYHTTFNERLAEHADQLHTIEQAEAFKADGVQFMVTRFGERHRRVKLLKEAFGDTIPILNPDGQWYQKFRQAVRTSPNMGMIAIAHILEHNVKSVHVAGMDFHVPWKGYRPGYGGFTPAQARRGTGAGGWGQGSAPETSFPHNPYTQMGWLRKTFHNDPRLSFDADAVENLSLNVERTVTAIVPMKGDSERVPQKNTRKMHRRPMLYWILKSLTESEYVRRIVVPTDSERVMGIVRRSFPRVETFLQHSDVSNLTMNDALATYLPNIEGEHFIQCHATSPLLSRQTIDEAIDLYFDMQDHDSVLTVTKHQGWFYDKEMMPINFDPSVLARSQDLDPVYESNSALFVFSRESFNETKKRTGQTPYFMEINRVESLDVDTEEDFEIAAAVLAGRKAR